MTPSFAERVIAWQRQQGRHDLPWQNTRDPYAIWVSEIMLQQTQVSTAIDYYLRFMARYPDVAQLAAAEPDEVLRYWSGLGYYARARNLHDAAQCIMTQHGGQIPQTRDALQQLPGIGRSTAAAISIFAWGERAAILDGNVKRVLARCFGIRGWPGKTMVERALWSLAETLLPPTDIEGYSQGLMDLGATVCARHAPGCVDCPLAESCFAHHNKLETALPDPRPAKKVPQRAVTLLLLIAGHEILLEKRPARGLWGGLWSLPEIAPEADVSQILKQRFGFRGEPLPALPPMAHTFTHFRLNITPLPIRINAAISVPGTVWLARDEAVEAAIPAPVRKILRSYHSEI